MYGGIQHPRRHWNLIDRRVGYRAPIIDIRYPSGEAKFATYLQNNQVCHFLSRSCQYKMLLQSRLLASLPRVEKHQQFIALSRVTLRIPMTEPHLMSVLFVRADRFLVSAEGILHLPGITSALCCRGRPCSGGKFGRLASLPQNTTNLLDDEGETAPFSQCLI